MSLKFPGPIYWSSLARKHLENVNVYKMVDANGICIAHFIGDPNNFMDIDQNLLWARGWVLITERDTFEGKVFLAESLWTCRCNSNFIKSKLSVYCPLCKTALKNATERIPYYTEILKWETFLLDAKGTTCLS